MAHIINNPHALYYNGELIGIITNPDPIGNIEEIIELLNQGSSLCDAKPMHPSTELTEVIRPLPETVDAGYLDYDTCYTNKTHLVTCDKDGYCDICGEQ